MHLACMHVMHAACLGMLLASTCNRVVHASSMHPCRACITCMKSGCIHVMSVCPKFKCCDNRYLVWFRTDVVCRHTLRHRYLILCNGVIHAVLLCVFMDWIVNSMGIAGSLFLAIQDQTLIFFEHSSYDQFQKYGLFNIYSWLMCLCFRSIDLYTNLLSSVRFDCDTGWPVLETG